MPRFPAFLFALLAIGSCAPPEEEISLGPPSSKALRTNELAQDASQRIDLLASQTDLTNNAIFANYQRRKVAQWNGGWTRRIDLTGVSWSHRQAGTAITPRHLVFAAHYMLKIGTNVTFHDRKGQVHSRKLIKAMSLRKRKDAGRSDITVALLDRPLPASIKTYRLLPPRSDYEHTLVGVPALVTEQQRRVFIHRVRRVNRGGISFMKNPDYPESLFKNLIKGDSGHPTFLLVGGEPVLVETHTGGGGGAGPFYSHGPIFQALTEAVASLDPSFKVKTVPLDPKLAPAPPEEKKVTPKPKPPRINRVPSQTTPPKSSQPPTPRAPRVRRVPTTPPAN